MPITIVFLFLRTVYYGLHYHNTAGVPVFRYYYYRVFYVYTIFYIFYSITYFVVDRENNIIYLPCNVLFYSCNSAPNSRAVN